MAANEVPPSQGMYESGKNRCFILHSNLYLTSYLSWSSVDDDNNIYSGNQHHKKCLTNQRSLVRFPPR